MYLLQLQLFFFYKKGCEKGVGWNVDFLVTRAAASLAFFGIVLLLPLLLLLVEYVAVQVGKNVVVALVKLCHVALKICLLRIFLVAFWFKKNMKNQATSNNKQQSIFSLTNTKINAISGAFSGVVVAVAMSPLDVIRVRLTVHQTAQVFPHVVGKSTTTTAAAHKSGLTRMQNYCYNNNM